jgi:hypothetical protein
MVPENPLARLQRSRRLPLSLMTSKFKGAVIPSCVKLGAKASGKASKLPQEAKVPHFVFAPF